MARSGWVAVLITALLVGGFGSPAADDAAAKAKFDLRPVADSVTSFPRWSTESFGGDSDMVGPIVLKVVLLLACVFLCAGLAGRVGPSMASFLGGWGALVVSAALAGAVFNLVTQLVVANESDRLLGTTLLSINAGALFGLYTGWLVGGSVAIAARNARIEPRWVPPVPGSVPTAGQAPEYPPALPPGPPVPPVAPSLPGGWPAATGAQTMVDPGALSSSEFPSAADYAELNPTTGMVPAIDPDPDPDPDATADEPPPAEETAPVWSSAWQGRGGGGAYSAESKPARPSWTRWSSNDDT
jgi:hypothetical protein